MTLLIVKKLGLINLNHVRAIHKIYCGLKIEYANGDSRNIQLPSGTDIDALLEELSLQIVKSQIVDFDSLLERFQTCGHKNRSAVCGHKESTGPATVDTTGVPVSVDTDRIQGVDTSGAAGSVDTKEDVHSVDTSKTQKKIVKTCPICGKDVWWCADCITEFEEPSPEQCSIYRELENGFASKEKFAKVLGSHCWYCSYLSKVYCKTGETKEISWDDIDKETDYKNLIWIEINERVRYAHDEENDVFILQHKKDGTFQTLKKFRYEDLKKIWDALPERATAEDVRDVAKRVGVNVGSLGYYLMRIFTHVKFGGDIINQRTGGHPRMVLIKNPDDVFFREEIRRQLRLERDLIGKVDSYGGV